MLHYTLNTGDCDNMPRSMVSEDMISTFRPLAAKRIGTLPGEFSAFRVIITREGDGGAVFTIWNAQALMVSCALAWRAESEGEIWAAIEKMYLDLPVQYPGLFQLLREPVKPDTLPWLTVIILPDAHTIAQRDIEQLLDFTRYIAFAIMEHG